MARPRRENGDYFKLYVGDQELDESVTYLESLHGADGFRFYYRMLEFLTKAERFRLPVSEARKKIWASKTGTDYEKFCEMLNDALNPEIGALVMDGECLSSPYLDRVMSGLVQKRERMREQYEQEQAEKGVSESEIMQEPEETGQSESETTQQSKAEQSTAEERKGQETDDPPSQDENPHNPKMMRWKALSRGGLIDPVIQTVLLFKRWDGDLEGDLKKSLPPDDRIDLVDVTAEVRKQLQEKTVEMIEKSMIALERDEWRVKQGHASVVWLMDLPSGKQAVQRIRQWSGKGGGGPGGVGLRWMANTKKRSGESCGKCGISKTVYELRNGTDEVHDTRVLCSFCELEELKKEAQE